MGDTYEQTAIVVTLPDGGQMLVCLVGAHHAPREITVDCRPNPYTAWKPYSGNVEIRLERGTYGRT